MASHPKANYLGFDLSTQQLKCLVIDQDLKLLHSESIEFDKDLSSYKTEKGVYLRDDGTVECPVAMWLEALDLVFQRMSENKDVDLGSVRAMSGSCQQHGSVYWAEEGPKLLPTLDFKQSLKDQLFPDAFSRSVAPNWQDHSTGSECQQFEDSVGGPVELARLTGSRAHHRFTGPQMMKISKKEPEVYRKTAKISLVSSFLASVLAGEFTSLEEADACGMNLYNIDKRDYEDNLLRNIDDDLSGLREKLGGAPINCDKPTPVGSISSYFVQKYGLNADCQVFPFTGDNLATICSLRLKPNDVLVSLGTSTTILLVTDQYHPSPNYHLFIHPTIPKHYMGMICYCNGALAREKIRDQLSDSHDWEPFNAAVTSTTIENDNEIACYFPLGEIVPNVPSVCRRATFEKSETGDSVKLNILESFANVAHDARNIVESQALSCRVRISPLLSSDCTDTNSEMGDSKVLFDYDNFPLSEYRKRPRRAFFVGGASKNDAIVNLFAQVLGATDGNFRLETPNSCALGGCYRALWSHLHYSNLISSPFDQFLNEAFRWDFDVQSLGLTDEKDWKHYNTKIQALSELEKTL